MNTKTWRDHARPIIAAVLKETAGKPEVDIRKALKDAYPFGMREYHPYKIWLDEIKVQRGTKKRKPHDIHGRKVKPVDPAQGSLL